MAPSEILEAIAQAEDGDASAQLAVGCWYSGDKVIVTEGGDLDWEGGDGFQRGVPNGERAAFWLERAAEQGSREAQRLLGRLYDEGELVQRDHKKAVRWYERACAQNDGDAQYFLGSCLWEGRGGDTGAVQVESILDPELESAWFQPLPLACNLPVSKSTCAATPRSEARRREECRAE
jgi:TPR repeat protein